MNKSRFEVTLYIDDFTKPIKVFVPLDEMLVEQILEPLEKSNDPFSLMLKSYPNGGDYLVHRKKVMDLRSRVADGIMLKLRDGLAKAMEVNDKSNGYSED